MNASANMTASQARVIKRVWVAKGCRGSQNISNRGCWTARGSVVMRGMESPLPPSRRLLCTLTASHTLCYTSLMETSQPSAPSAHRIKWFVYAGRDKIPHTSRMRGQWGYDVECSCGWQTRTGGATKRSVSESAWLHKFDTRTEESQ